MIRVPVTMFNQDFGTHPAEKCVRCGATFLSQETMCLLEEETRRRGIPMETQKGREVISLQKDAVLQ